MKNKYHTYQLFLRADTSWQPSCIIIGNDTELTFKLRVYFKV